MHPLLEVALGVAAVAVVIMTIFVITTAIYLKGQLDAMERTVTGLKVDFEQLVRESKDTIVRINHIAEKVEDQMDDVKHITSTARAWTDRADRLVEEAGPLMEVPVFFLSDKFKTIRSFCDGVFQSLKNPR